jgi:hypothetical protein
MSRSRVSLRALALAFVACLLLMAIESPAAAVVRAASPGSGQSPNHYDPASRTKSTIHRWRAAFKQAGRHRLLAPDGQVRAGAAGTGGESCAGEVLGWIPTWRRWRRTRRRRSSLTAWPRRPESKRAPSARPWSRSKDLSCASSAPKWCPRRPNRRSAVGTAGIGHPHPARVRVGNR